MSLRDAIKSAPENASGRRKWMWIGVAGTACLLSWLALGVGIALDVGTGAMIALVTAAAVTTEGTVWLAALMLGISAYQARRHLWQKVRGRFR